MTTPYGYVGGPVANMNHGMMGHMTPMMAPPPPPPGGVQMNPATNNQPLQFNKNKGKAPMPVVGGMDYDMRGGGEMLHVDMAASMNTNINTDMDLEREESNDSGGVSSTMGNNQMMAAQWQMNPQMMQSMMGDPSMMMASMTGAWGPGMGPIGPMEMQPLGPRPLIEFNSCTLYPPPPTAPAATSRERPPGCRTVFVGGLPENVTEDIIREVFDSCGSITSLRISKKKNFCHLRFDEEYAVDKALVISAYRMKIDNQDDKPNTGRIHVDYAQARDDLYDWECNQRALAREMRHRYRLEQDRLRPPSPPPVIHFSDHESQVLVERLKGDETFAQSSEILMTWLERGDCNRRTSNVFYSMIQSVNAHVRRLTNEKSSYNEEYEQMKGVFRQRLEGILRQFEQIDKVFKAANKQKAWDHFSKAQRKNIDTWKNQCQEIKSREEQEFFRERKEDEMEMSDSEESTSGEPNHKKKKLEDGEMIKLRDENDSLKCQLEAYKNEVIILKQEHQDDKQTDEKDKQIKIFQQTLQGMQQQLMTSKKDVQERESSLKAKILQLEYDNSQLKLPQVDKNKPETEGEKDENDDDDGEETARVEIPTSSSQSFTDRQARLVGLISTFLHVHPLGASVDYIGSYLQALDIRIRTSQIEDILEMCPSAFRQNIIGIGASIEKRWKFIGFTGLSSP